MEKRNKKELIEQFDNISKFCQDSGKPLIIVDGEKEMLVVMSIDAFRKQTIINQIQQEMMEIELKRAKGAKDSTIDELDNSLKEILIN